MRITRINIGGVSFETGAVNVFVGKNNSGKSTLLREVSALCFPQNHTQFKDTKWKAEIAISVSPLKRTMEEVFERPDLIPEVESANTNEVVSHLRPRVTKSIEHSSAVNGRRLSGIATSSCYESGEPFELTVDDRGGVGSDVGASNHVLEWILDFLSTVHISTEFCEDRLSKSFGTRIEDIEAMASGPADRIASLYLNEAMQEDMNLVLEKSSTSASVSTISGRRIRACASCPTAPFPTTLSASWKKRAGGATTPLCCPNRATVSRPLPRCC